MTREYAVSDSPPSPDTLKAESRAFYAYLTNSLGRPQNEAEVKAWIWKAIKDGFRPALLETNHVYQPEDSDAE